MVWGWLARARTAVPLLRSVLSCGPGVIVGPRDISELILRLRHGTVPPHLSDTDTPGDSCSQSPLISGWTIYHGSNIYLLRNRRWIVHWEKSFRYINFRTYRGFRFSSSNFLIVTLWFFRNWPSSFEEKLEKWYNREICGFYVTIRSCRYSNCAEFLLKHDGVTIYRD